MAIGIAPVIPFAHADGRAGHWLRHALDDHLCPGPSPCPSPAVGRGHQESRGDDEFACRAGGAGRDQAVRGHVRTVQDKAYSGAWPESKCLAGPPSGASILTERRAYLPWRDRFLTTDCPITSILLRRGFCALGAQKPKGSPDAFQLWFLRPGAKTR